MQCDVAMHNRSRWHKMKGSQCKAYINQGDVCHLGSWGLQGCRGRPLGVGVLLEEVRDGCEASSLGHVGQNPSGLQSPLL